MDYFLMRKDDVITICDISESGEMISWSEKLLQRERTTSLLKTACLVFGR